MKQRPRIEDESDPDTDARCLLDCPGWPRFNAAFGLCYVAAIWACLMKRFPRDQRFIRLRRTVDAAAERTDTR